MSFINDIISLKYSDFRKNISEKLTIEFILKFLVVYFIVVWIAILVWVIKDITNRTTNVFLQLISILTVLILTPFWIFIYLLIRPWKTILEKYYWEIEDNLDSFSEVVEERIKQKDQKSNCYKCNKAIWQDFMFCPYCKQKLNRECKSCNKLIYIWWEICPFCWDEQKNENKIIEK